MKTRREGEGKFFQASRRLGAAPSLKNTEKGGFFLTSNVHKINFQPGRGHEVVIGPRDNGSRFPGLAVALDGPALVYFVSEKFREAS